MQIGATSRARGKTRHTSLSRFAIDVYLSIAACDRLSLGLFFFRPPFLDKSTRINSAGGFSSLPMRAGVYEQWERP